MARPTLASSNGFVEKLRPFQLCLPLLLKYSGKHIRDDERADIYQNQILTGNTPFIAGVFRRLNQYFPGNHPLSDARRKALIPDKPAE